MGEIRRFSSGAAALLLLLGIFWLAFPPPVDEAAQATSTERIGSLHDLPALISDIGTAAGRDIQEAIARRQALIALHDDLSLHAVGSQLYTAWNAPVTLKAINWYGFDYAPFVAEGLESMPLDTILAGLRSLGFNALRVPFASEMVESNPAVTQDLAANPQLRGFHSLDILQRIIERAHRFGLRVILVNSRSEGGRGPEIKTGLWYTQQYPESSWINDWLTLAKRLRSDSAFVGVDLRNEPHITGSKFDEQAYFTLGPLWGAYHGTYYHDRDWHYAAETLGNMLLAINPHLLIIVEGVQMYLDPDRGVLTGGLWGGNLIGVQYDPIVLSRPGQLVYSVHEYGPHMWQGNWFNPKTTYASLARRWDALWGYLLTASKSLQAPVFVGEFGTCHEYFACVSSSEGWKQGFWFKSFVRYLSLHSHVGWAYWALNPTGPFHPGDVNFYSLISSDWHHYYPMLTDGLAPILHEPSGVWNAAPPTGEAWTAQPGCVGMHSCIGGPQAGVSGSPGAPPPGSAVSGSPGAPSPGSAISGRIDAPTPARSAQVMANVAYAGVADPQRSGDLYVPVTAGAGTRPGVIIVHGRTWDRGTKGTVGTTSLARALAMHGYVVFDINYRLAGQGGRFPRDVRDVKAAASYLAANASRYRINPAQIGAIGVGAGGYLAMMAAYTPNNPPFVPHAYPASATRIAAVASFFTPIHLADITDPAEAQSLTAYLGAGYLGNTKLLDQSSPTTYVNSGVPTLLFQGLNDPDAPFYRTFRLYKYLRQRAIGSQLIDLPGAPHALGELSPSVRVTAVGQVISFLDGVFYKH